MENRNGLVTGTRLTPAAGTTEREAGWSFFEGLAVAHRPGSELVHEKASVVLNQVECIDGAGGYMRHH
jgi:hypothetical protein